MNQHAKAILFSAIGMFSTVIFNITTKIMYNGGIQTVKFNTNAAYFSGDVNMTAVEASLQLNRLPTFITIAHVAIFAMFALILLYNVAKIIVKNNNHRRDLNEN